MRICLRIKKNGQREAMIDAVESLRSLTAEPYRTASADLGVCYASLMRWRGRKRQGKMLVDRPGPEKTKPLDCAALSAQIMDLKFKKYRTGGTGALYRKFMDQISRRDVGALVWTARLEYEGHQAALARRIRWLVPGLVSGADDQDKAWVEKCRAYVTMIHDYGSRYALSAHGDDAKPTGLGTALAVERGLEEVGFNPLFFKVDHGSAYLSREVREVLDERFIIPLVSPVHYAPYNGGTERTHQDIIRFMEDVLEGRKVDGLTLRLACNVCRQKVNHLIRRSLDGRTACEVLQEARPFMQAYGRRQRREAYDEIRALTVDIVRELGDDTDMAVETAFRYAAETWMQLNNMIEVTQNGVVLPPFYQIRSH